MSEPNYLPRPAYQAIAEALSPQDIYGGIEAAMEAHRTIAAGFIKDEQLTPRQLEYVDAVRYWIKHGQLKQRGSGPFPAESFVATGEVVAHVPAKEAPTVSMLEAVTAGQFAEASGIAALTEESSQKPTKPSRKKL